MDQQRKQLEACVIFTPPRFGDERGYFCETYNRAAMKDLGVDVEFVQDNQTLSAKAGTLRGLHYQAPPFAQDKLVRVGRGRAFDVAVDVRKGSPDYGKWMGVELSAENGKQFFIPKGFLHGFVTLEDNTEFLYKVSDYYSAEADGSVRFDDTDLKIDWPYEGELTLSEKDQNAPAFKDWDSPFVYGENC